LAEVGGALPDRLPYTCRVPLPASAAAFDAIASRYDDMFSAAANPLIAMMRARVLRAVDRHFPAPARLVEIGCGTGEDALSLVGRGHRVIACDPAPAMIAAARAKVAAAGKADAVEFLSGSVEEIAEAWPSRGHAVDGVYSNFAPLNCEPSLAPLRLLLERALRRGGRFIGVVLPRLCPLEVALFLARAEPRAALRRFRRAAVADVEGQRFTMRYYGAADFDRALGPGFRRIETRSLGLVLPPLSFGNAFARVPGLLPALGALEDRISALPGLRRMGDHVLLVYERA
jgi:ubiquinone/menaquinone biosynthesis C-methylase UbiE